MQLYFVVFGSKVSFEIPFPSTNGIRNLSKSILNGDLYLYSNTPLQYSTLPKISSPTTIRMNLFIKNVSTYYFSIYSYTILIYLDLKRLALFAADYLRVHFELVAVLEDLADIENQQAQCSLSK